MAESLGTWKRSQRVAEISEADIGKELCLMGWCHRRRDLGKLIFLTLRDRSGELQLIVDEDSEEALFQKAQQVRSEFVLAVKGVLRLRKDPNPEMETGRFELLLREIKILAEAKTPPFYIEDGIDARESLRLEYRYLDLRRPEMQKKIMLRHQINFFTREWFNREGFLDIETPVLVKSTPEGARDYLVPSRIFPGKFFALPQSPQLYKQLLMCSGFDRYMQIARCFRDEDLRADRQPDFTQIDLEMSFVDEDDVMNLVERYIKNLFKAILGVEIKDPLPRLEWEEGMERFGSDKPDTRFAMELKDFSAVAEKTEFKVFRDCLASGGSVRGFAVPSGADMKRRRIDELTEFAKDAGAKGLIWMSVEDQPRGSAAKYLSADFVSEAAALAGASKGDLLFFVADEKYKALNILGRLRLEVAKSRGLIPDDKWALLWVTHFPMFEYSEEEQRLVAEHHPFTSPLDEDLDRLMTEPTKVHAKAYDIVLNGNELGGGSIRIHDQELQKNIFKLIGLSQEEAEERFGFLLKAFEYGVPPHGGLAFGLDRVCMLLSKSESIRDVIAFPKVQNSSCLMTGCPDYVDQKQLDELGIELSPATRSAIEAQRKGFEDGAEHE